MSGNCKCSLFVSNEVDATVIAMEPTDVQAHIVNGPSNVEPGAKGQLVVKTKGTSGTATGSHVHERLNLKKPDGTYLDGYIEISISCPFSSSNSYDLNVVPPFPYHVIHQLRSKSGPAVVDVVIRDISNDFVGDE